MLWWLELLAGILGALACIALAAWGDGDPGRVLGDQPEDRWS